MHLGEGIKTNVSWGTIAVAIALSGAVHLALFAALGGHRLQPPKPNVPVEFEVVSVPPAPPPPEPAAPPEPEPAPAPPPPKPRMATVEKPPPPPPNASPSSAEPPAKPAPVKIGVTLDSTAQAGSFALGVGNSLYGKADDKATDPNAVRPYAAAPTPAAARYVPSTRLTSMPKKLSEPRVEYPEEAKRAGVEGEVKLLLRIDETGKVVGVKILKGPGYGLEAAAQKAAWSWRFQPALADGSPVVTEIPLTYTFYLE